MEQENKMGVMPMNKLVISMSLPMMVSMLVQALYNIVDSLFVARVSEGALSAVSLAFPIQTLMIAITGGTAVGIGTLLSRALGEKNHEQVSKLASHGVILVFAIYAVFVLMGLFAVEPFIKSQTTDPSMIKYGVDYLRIVCICSIGMCTQMIFERFLQSTGKTTLSMVTQLIGAITNIILDPIFIFGYFGVPRMEVAGAAVATVIGQIIAALAAVVINFKKNSEIDFKLKGFKPSWGTVGQIYVIGIPSIIMQSIGSVMVYGLNKILMGFTSTATAVFGAYFKLQSFIFMPVFGLNNGLVPIIAYNYGARKRERVVQAIKLGMIYAISIMFVGIIVFQLIPTALLNMFDASEQMMKIGIPALKIISIHFPLAGFCIIAGSACQALGFPIYSMITSICRQLVVLLPVAYILSKIGTVETVWWAFPIAELVSLALNVVFLTITNKRVIRPLGNQE